METKRIDEIELGGRDPRFDVVCPVCKAAIGSPCYQQKLDGCERVPWIHPERIQDVISQNGH